MNRIALVLPYYGKLPNYFDLWLRTASYNKDLVDYILFTDCDMSEYTIPNNVIVYKSSLDDVKNRVSVLLPFKYVLHNAYKLCDYKPLYGVIFKNELERYEFWGHCDPDIIWGKLSHFITEEVLKEYDRIYSHGHLCMYRNNDTINNCIIEDYLKHGVLAKSGISIRDIYGHRYVTHFDESKEIQSIFTGPNVNMKLYDSTDFADIETGKKEFECIDFINGTREKRSYFKWSNGELFGIDNCSEKEYCYIHLQKRKMDVQVSGSINEFIIVPNIFLNKQSLTSEEVEKWSKPDSKWEKDYKKWCIKSKVKNVKDGALIFRIKRRLSKNG